MNHTNCQFRDKHTVGGIVFYKHAFLVCLPFLVISGISFRQICPKGDFAMWNLCIAVIGGQRDRFFYPYLTLMIDSFSGTFIKAD